jgi:hypothetical protein
MIHEHNVPPGPLLSRRDLIALSGLGLGGLAYSTLFPAKTSRADDIGGVDPAISLTPKPAHFDPKAKSVILMMQTGGPSQMDLFDPKPALQKYDGKRFTVKVETFEKGSEDNVVMKSPFAFQHHGECGMELSELIPQIGGVADELCLIRSMYTEHNSHPEALMKFMTGNVFQGRPSFGSWICYALGTSNQNLPANVVLRDAGGYPENGPLNWTSGWLPALFRGTEFSTVGAPILNLRPNRDLPAGVQRDNMAFLEKLNRLHQRKYPRESDLESRIANHALATRIPDAVEQLLDLDKETAETRKLYGLDNPDTKSYGLRCLMARKLVEAGVRFVQIYPELLHVWDHHSELEEGLVEICEQTDLPTAGLIKDLKQRNLLEDTVVIWGGEFGRLPVSQVKLKGAPAGRDHNRHGFSLFLAGGGFKSGYVHGETDEFGYKAIRDPVSIADLHATILHQLGLDHELLTFEHSGRDESLTDAGVTGAQVVSDLLVDG